MPWWDACTTLELAGVTARPYSHVSLMMATGRSPWRLEESSPVFKLGTKRTRDATNQPGSPRSPGKWSENCTTMIWKGSESPSSSSAPAMGWWAPTRPRCPAWRHPQLRWAARSRQITILSSPQPLHLLASGSTQSWSMPAMPFLVVKPSI